MQNPARHAKPASTLGSAAGKQSKKAVDRVSEDKVGVGAPHDLFIARGKGAE